MSRLAAARHNPVVKAFYEQLRAVRKAPTRPLPLYAQGVDDSQDDAKTLDLWQENYAIHS
jgi:hypothetical protein